ncbi:hypothetical protein AZOA_29700 [Azoarcus sp. Aa7]|nr:hypothetical protein [Azoarcus sp. Aa7]
MPLKHIRVIDSDLNIIHPNRNKEALLRINAHIDTRIFLCIISAKYEKYGRNQKDNQNIEEKRRVTFDEFCPTVISSAMDFESQHHNEINITDKQRHRDLSVAHYGTKPWVLPRQIVQRSLCNFRKCLVIHDSRTRSFVVDRTFDISCIQDTGNSQSSRSYAHDINRHHPLSQFRSRAVRYSSEVAASSRLVLMLVLREVFSLRCPRASNFAPRAHRIPTPGV